jgi:hypothetical protein
MKWSVATTAVLVAVLGVTSCGGEAFDDRLDRVSSMAERPLQRLQESIDQASPRDSSSLVILRETANRTAVQLAEAQDSLQDLEPDGSSERRAIAELGDAIDASHRLSQTLSRRPLLADEIKGLGVQASTAIGDLQQTHLPRVDVSSLAAALDHRQRGRRATGQGGSSTTSTPPSSPVARPDFVGHSAFGYQAQIPSGAGWSSPSDSQPTPGRLFRTSVRGPSGMFVIIDYTPSEAATFGGRYDSKQDVGQTAFGTASKYVFQGGRLPECERARCVDYIINDRASTQGFGVLAGGPDFGLVSDIASTVAESLTAPEGE